MPQGAIILCGGKSNRMGADKALLPFGNETMLERTVRTVASIVDPQRIVVVAAAKQPLPPLQTIVIRDRDDYSGPLKALACGFAALPPGTDALFVTGCDTPLLAPAVIESLFADLAEHDAVVPQDAERLHPLCAVYRSSVLRNIDPNEHRSLHSWLEQLNVKRMPVENLRQFDPELNSLRNVNTGEDYVEVLRAAGLSTP